MRFVSLLRPSPLLLSLSLSSTEGERARDSFNNPAARSEIYYFRATLLDKSIRLMPTLSLAPPLHPSLCLSPTPTTALSFSFLFFSFFSPLLFLFFLPHSQPRPPSVLSRTSVLGDLIKSVHLNEPCEGLCARTVSCAIPPLVETEDGTISRIIRFWIDRETDIFGRFVSFYRIDIFISRGKGWTKL